MKKTLIPILILFEIFYSCKDLKSEEKVVNNQIKDSLVINSINGINRDSIQNKDLKINEVNKGYLEDKDTLEYQGDKYAVYNEYKMRGKGVLSLDISKELIILNEDNTVFGNIKSFGESDYEINLPSKIIARSLVPIFDKFYFDGEEPTKKDEFLKIYINKELKKIKKNQVQYKYSKWEDYVKDEFIKLRNYKNSTSKNKDLNVYEVLEIIDDSMKIKSVSKKTCDAIEKYENITKNIKWKNSNQELMIHFFSCD